MRLYVSKNNSFLTILIGEFLWELLLHYSNMYTLISSASTLDMHSRLHCRKWVIDSCGKLSVQNQSKHCFKVCRKFKHLKHEDFSNILLYICFICHGSNGYCFPLRQEWKHSSIIVVSSTPNILFLTNKHYSRSVRVTATPNCYSYTTSYYGSLEREVQIVHSVYQHLHHSRSV